jgi:hypothetical protein
MSQGAVRSVLQAWVLLKADDPAAVSALTVARRALAAGRGLTSLRRFRLFELSGRLPPRPEVEELLHRSIQFYNPHKEACIVRAGQEDPAPAEPGEQLVLVFDRGGERRVAAERWWSHVTGEAVEVREGVVWALRFAPGVEAPAAAAELAVLRDQARGLLCNPHAQEHRLAEAGPPLPWLGPVRAPRARRSA